MAASETVENLYLTERRALTTIAWMILGSLDEAEDAVHEAFVRLEARGLDGIDNPIGYLRTIVRNESRSVLRRRKRTEPTDELVLLPHLDAATHEFASSLMRLTIRRRTAIVLRYYADLPVLQIAQIMGCRPATVSSLIHRALRDLEGDLRET